MDWPALQMTEGLKALDQRFARVLRGRLNSDPNLLMLGYADWAKRLEYSILVYGVYRFPHIIAMLPRSLLAVNYFRVISDAQADAPSRINARPITIL